MAKQSKPQKQKSKFEVIFEQPAVRIVVGVVGLGLMYVFASWAIDSGSLLDYAITFLFFVTGLRELIGGIRGLMGGKV
jgi:hypothetical protein